MVTKLTPLQAIRKKCIDCSGGKPSEARQCPKKDCPLYWYRMGKYPQKSAYFTHGFGGKRDVSQGDAQ